MVQKKSGNKNYTSMLLREMRHKVSPPPWAHQNSEISPRHEL